MSVVRRLYRDVGEFVIEIQDWEILDRGVTVLWGPSGAGKTTVMNTLVGFEEDSQLSWDWQGVDLGRLPVEKRKLGVVFQELGLFPHLSVKENLLFPVQNHTHPHWKDDFEWISETLDLKKMMNSQIQKLSGGEKQRLALARALIFRPRMLLLDEPFSSMDESLRGRAREMVLKASEHLKCPVLLITHDRKDVEAMAQKVSQIEKGRLVSESKTL